MRIRPTLVGVGLLAAVAAHADEVVYRMSGPVLPVAHSANGYTVAVREQRDGVAEVRVETLLNPIGARGPYAAVEAADGPSVPEGFVLPRKLRNELSSEQGSWEAATTVLRWVSDHLELVDDDHRPQDARSVLKRRGGRCSGLANATAALLMGAGFDARTVSGLLVTTKRTIPHRWVEVRLPGAGWVPTDPTLGLWVITARHVVFADAVMEAPEVEIVSAAEGELRALPRTGNVVIRPNEGAELVCRISDATSARTVVALLERGSDLRRGTIGPEVRFGDLLPGRWRLEIEVEGRVVERRELTLEAGVVHSYVVRLPPEADVEVGS